MSTTTTAGPSPARSNQGGTNYVVTQTTFVAIATLLVFVRIYVRTIVVKKFGLDDAVIILALVSNLYPDTSIKPTRLRVFPSLSAQ